MGEQVFLTIVMCICGKMQPKEEAINCLEHYVNCAIVKDGKILTKEEFDKKCQLVENQQKCY